MSRPSKRCLTCDRPTYIKDAWDIRSDGQIVRCNHCRADLEAILIRDTRKRLGLEALPKSPRP